MEQRKLDDECAMWCGYAVLGWTDIISILKHCIHKHNDIVNGAKTGFSEWEKIGTKNGKCHISDGAVIGKFREACGEKYSKSHTDLYVKLNALLDDALKARNKLMHDIGPGFMKEIVSYRNAIRKEVPYADAIKLKMGMVGECRTRICAALSPLCEFALIIRKEWHELK